MSFLATEVRAGAYADSIVLMQLQSDLERLDGVQAAGVVMGTAVNLDLLRAADLLADTDDDIGPEDLVIAVRARTQAQSQEALAQIDGLLRQKSTAEAGDYRPRSLATARRLAPAARWVSVSVPGRYAPAVARQALELGLNVFLYSDNVAVDDEVELKAEAATRGRLLLGPDCGSAIIGGVGFGFTNSVRRGVIGLVSASGTGLQAISSRIHQAGAGISHALGTGGRDLSSEVGAATARQALDLLARDADSRVVVLSSKPPADEIGAQVLAQALRIPKPVVVYFSGWPVVLTRVGPLHFVGSLDAAADLAVELAQRGAPTPLEEPVAAGGDLRGLFAGGTLALEATQALRPFLPALHSNLGVAGTLTPADPATSSGHTILDLGADEYTVGRLHPMMDPQLRLDRLRQEAADPRTGLLLLDLVLGRGAHPDPAAHLAPAIAEIRRQRELPVVVLLIGTDEDPQGLAETGERLTAAGAAVYTELGSGLAHAVRCCVPAAPPVDSPIEADCLETPTEVINVGLEGFREDFLTQEVPTVQVDWRPPAGGDEKLMAILEKMKS